MKYTFYYTEAQGKLKKLKALTSDEAKTEAGDGPVYSISEIVYNKPELLRAKVEQADWETLASIAIAFECCDQLNRQLDPTASGPTIENFPFEWQRDALESKDLEKILSAVEEEAYAGGRLRELVQDLLDCSGLSWAKGEI